MADRKPRRAVTAADIPPERAPTERMKERIRRSLERDDAQTELRVVYASEDEPDARERALAILARLLDPRPAPGKA